MDAYSVQEISLRDAFLIPIWKKRVLVLFLTLFFGLLALCYALLTPNMYQAKAILASSESGSSGSLSSLVGQFGGVASMAGLNIGGDGDPAATIEELIYSPDFLYQIIEKHKLLIKLFAIEKWDKNTNQLVIDEDIYDESKGVWVREVDEGKDSKPTLWEAHIKLKNSITSNYRKKDGVFTIEVEHLSPYVAKYLLELFIEEINLFYKNKDINRIRKEIDYLNEQVGNTEVAEFKEVFFNLIAEKLKTQMLSITKDDYVLTYIAKPVVPEVKHRPKRAFIVVIGLFLGFIISSMIAIVRNN